MTHPTGPGHPGPDPTPIGPHGPRTVRDLITHARHTGWDHVIYVMGDAREHVWTSPAWRVSLYPPTGDVVLTVERRHRTRHVSHTSRVAEVHVTSAGQAAAVLAALGVLPPALGHPITALSTPAALVAAGTTPAIGASR